MSEATEEAARIEALQAERHRLNLGVKGDFGLGPERPIRLDGKSVAMAQDGNRSLRAR